MKKSLVPLQHYLYMYPIIFTSYNLSISSKNLTKYHNIKLWKGGGGFQSHPPLPCTNMFIWFSPKISVHQIT